MKAKEKAKELVDRFYNVDLYDVDYGGGGCTCPAKEYALICVDEILESHYKVLVGVMPKKYDYWIEVQQEINKL